MWYLMNILYIESHAVPNETEHPSIVHVANHDTEHTLPHDSEPVTGAS